MKMHLEIVTAEGAARAARVSQAASLVWDEGEQPAIGATPAAPRTRRSKEQIAADEKAAADKIAADKAAADKAAADAKPAASDPADLYSQLGGKLPETPAAPAASTPAEPEDPLAALMAAESSAPAGAKSRDEMVAGLTKLMSEKGIPWVREHIIGVAGVAKFSAMPDEMVTQLFVAHCK